MKTEFKKLYKYYEDIDIIYENLLDTLLSIGWINKNKYSSGQKNLMKLGTKTTVSHVINFGIDEGIELKIIIPKIGNQIFSFYLGNNSRSSILEISTKITFKDEMQKKEIKHNMWKIKSSFLSNCKDIDDVMRLELEKKGYKSFF